MVSTLNGRLGKLNQPTPNGEVALYAVVVTFCPREEEEDQFEAYDVLYLCESLEVARARFSERLIAHTEDERNRLRNEGWTPEEIATWNWTFQDTPDSIWAGTPDMCTHIRIWKVMMETDAMEIKD